MNLRHLILLLTVVPLVFAIGTFAYKVHKSSAKVSTLNHTSMMFNRIQAVTNAVHELQKERGMSAVFTTSRGETFKDHLIQQRLETDKKLQLLASTLQELKVSDFRVLNPDAIRELGLLIININSLRTKIDRFDLTVSQLLNFYSFKIANAINFMSQLNEMVTQKALFQDLVVLYSVVQMKEYACLERAMGVVGTDQGIFSEAVFNRFINLQGRQNSVERGYKLFSDNKQLKIIADFLDSSTYAEFSKARDVLIKWGPKGVPGSITSAKWWNLSTAYLEGLFTIEKTLGANFMNKVIAFKSDVIQTVFLMGVLLFFTIITLIGLVINAMRQLSSLSGNDLTMTNVMPEKDPHVTVPYQDRGRRDGERLAAERCVFKKNGYQGRCLVQEVVVEHDQLKGECRRCPINWIHNCSDQ